MPDSENLDGEGLARQGLNLQAVFDLDTLPADLVDQFSTLTPRLEHYTQLILLGHGGRLLWNRIEEQGAVSDDPIDEYSRRITTGFFEKLLVPDNFELVFPVEDQGVIGLQTLGSLIDWHHQTPFRVGINSDWGSWFAYRAVVLARSHFQPTPLRAGVSPCIDCVDMPCVSACPVMRKADNSLDISQCIDERKRGGSNCKDRCLSRLACPVAAEHRYTQEQVQYHYLRSMSMILEWEWE